MTDPHALELAGRSIVVTGGARGIGAAVARTLVKSGAGIVVADILDHDGEATASSLGSSCIYRRLDVTEEEQWRRVLDDAEANFGPLAVLVNNAGIVDFGSVESESPAMFRHVIDVNLTGAWMGMHVAVPRLRAAGDGVIVNISSTAGLMGYSGVAGYVASKWGLRGLTKAAAIELGKAGIRVCSVHPGPIHTPMTAGMDEQIAARQPLPRFGEPEEVAAMVEFIITEATFSTGSEFVIDGGATAGMDLVVQL
ncbi:SDR family NAD(P)-dependent oxidoreductase [Nocardia cyriacigeorgica]|uniref:SDR family NAD(P)-dependent oxidoreductase n=1 Tax=Nocardia cyriacigeorgica TaxID=135487 RepID=UPI000CEA04B2|nr:SDR family oxidoreductase [Nocardia cyriacigeorgica]PPJ03599.1 3-alpha-hydroxysteroid dehydrogenase [Nocardia cyriacigeorgica]